MANKIIVALVVLVALCDIAASQSCPRIVTRAEWGARAPTGTTPLSTYPPSHVIIHHAASASCSSVSSCSSLVKGFQDQHMDVNGWADIGYNFLVGGDGNAYQGRGWGLTGAHAPNFNSKSIGICFIGTFTSGLPTTAARNAAQQLIACGVGMGEISSSYLLAGHRQVTSTECPGNSLYSEIQGWPNWTSSP